MASSSNWDYALSFSQPDFYLLEDTGGDLDPARLGTPKTLSSYRDIDILPPLFEVFSRHRAAAPKDVVYVFTGKHGGPLQVDNLRNKVWYPALERANLRKRTMYQTRHTFASLMLAHGEDPLWVARMLGHTSTEMLYRHYGGTSATGCVGMG